MRRIGVAVALALAGALMTTVAAEAEEAPKPPPVIGAIAATSAQLYPDCLDIAVPYTLTLPAGATGFTLWLTARGPDGSTISADAASSTLGDATTGTAIFTVCGRVLKRLSPYTQVAHPGRYTVTATGTYTGRSIPRTEFTLTPSTLVFKPTKTRTSAHLNGNRVNVRVRDYRLDGFTPTYKARVFLQRRDGRQWVRIPGSNTSTDANGRATVRVKVNELTKVRAVTVPRHNWRRSVSKPIVVAP